MMTSAQPFRKFLGPAVCVLSLWGLSGCSKDADSTDGAGAGGSGATSGSSADVQAGAADGGDSSVVPSGSDAIVGTFQVQTLVDDRDDTTGMTKVVGTVGDGPVPSSVVWTVKKQDGDCVVETPSVPFCEAGCGADVCVGDNKCLGYPTNHSVGTVVLSGLTLTDGGTSVTLKEIAKAYQPPAGTSFAYPAFGAGDEIKLEASGGDYAAFQLSTTGVDPLRLTSTDFALDMGKPFALTWDAAKNAKASQIYLKLDISHHGGIRGMIECTTDDDGELTISADLMNELIGLGVAGFPSVVIMRQSIDTAAIAPGRVKLEVSSRVERYVTIAGVDSCTTDEDCPKGKTCRTADSTCQ